MYNPDYPTDQTAGWLAHTYQNLPSNEMYYWNGASGSFGYDVNSRRNMGTPMNPVNPFSQYGQYGTQNQGSIPESAVQPYSSYPPSTPQQNMGLNSMVESRRNMTTPQTNPQSNPWAQQAQMPTQTPQPQAYNSYMNNPGYFGGYMPGSIDHNTSALYGSTQFGFDKHNTWENYYTQNRPLPMPTIDWKNQQGCGCNMYSIPSGPQYPTPNQGANNCSWSDISKTNWNTIL